MGIQLSAAAQVLLAGKNYAVLATVNPDGSPHTSVMWVGRDGDDLLFSVQDNGEGIPTEAFERIFEKFVQVEATDDRRRGGTGLGLSIAKQIVSHLDGEIGFEPAPGGGTIFKVLLRAYAPGSAEPPQPQSAIAGGAPFVPTLI